MQVISYLEHNTIVKNLQNKLKNVSTIEEKCNVDALLSELFPTMMFWDIKNKQLVTSVNQNALTNIKRFLNRPTEVYHKH